ncbi:MAG: electron transport complex subunit RsxA [bacterium]|nr:electron transport complex subunit RsxA [bacterium]
MATELILLFVSAALVNNFVLVRFLGICPFLGVSKKVETATGMGMAVIFVMTMASMVTWTIQRYILDPNNLGFLQTIAFILIIASLVQLVEIVLARMMPTLYEALGIFLPLISTNCAILGLAILNIQNKYTLVESIIFALGASIGFTLALVIMAGIRERLELVNVPNAMKGAPITMITAGLLALAFMGFSGLVKM